MRTGRNLIRIIEWIFIVRQTRKYWSKKGWGFRFHVSNRPKIKRAG